MDEVPACKTHTHVGDLGAVFLAHDEPGGCQRRRRKKNDGGGPHREKQRNTRSSMVGGLGNRVSARALSPRPPSSPVGRRLCSLDPRCCLNPPSSSATSPGEIRRTQRERRPFVSAPTSVGGTSRPRTRLPLRRRCGLSRTPAWWRLLDPGSPRRSRLRLIEVRVGRSPRARGKVSCANRYQPAQKPEGLYLHAGILGNQQHSSGSPGASYTDFDPQRNFSCRARVRGE